MQLPQSDKRPVGHTSSVLPVPVWKLLLQNVHQRQQEADKADRGRKQQRTKRKTEKFIAKYENKFAIDYLPIIYDNFCLKEVS